VIRLSLIPYSLKKQLEKYSGNHIPISTELEKMAKRGEIVKYSVRTYSIFVYAKNDEESYVLPNSSRTNFGESKLICRNWELD